MKRFQTTTLALALSYSLSFSMSQAQEADPTKAPADVAAAPADAAKTKSGLASKVIKKGTGKEHPDAWDTVEVHYTGWTTDGKMFDSSVARGQTTSFPLNGVIKGWTEGVQLMVVGEKRRFWIPADLAYGENPGGGRPGGTLVFDIELVSITDKPAPPKAPENVATPPADAEKTASGLASKVLKKGSGDAKPKADSKVKLQITGWTTDGQMIMDTTSEDRGFVLPLAQAPIKGWSEAAQLMVAGEKRRFWIPESLASGANPAAGIPKGTLVFDIALEEIIVPGEKPKTPEDVAEVPKDAVKTASGLASKVLKKGTGDTKPTATSQVTVHYSGWTTDGKLFDSSVERGEPIDFPLNRVIKGWTEGVQLMVVGEKRRFWIPADLAYGEKPGGGRPGGMLVFDVELLKIK